MEEETQEFERAIINPYQAQSLTVTLRMLERILFSLDELYSDSGIVAEGAMVSLVNPLDAEQKAHLSRMSARARELIGLLSSRFALKHETANLAREVHGALVEMWANLEDTRSHKLRRYGAVSPGLAAELDPSIDELIRLVLAMDRALILRTPPAGGYTSGDGKAPPITQTGEVEDL